MTRLSIRKQGDGRAIVAILLTVAVTVRLAAQSPVPDEARPVREPKHDSEEVVVQDPLLVQPPVRHRLVVRLPVTPAGRSGEVTVHPNVQIAAVPLETDYRSESDVSVVDGDGPFADQSDAAGQPDWMGFLGSFQPAYPLPPPVEGPADPESLDAIWLEAMHGPTGAELWSAPEPMFGRVLQRVQARACENPCGPVARYLGPQALSGEKGIGHERVMLAPFQIDITQPFNNYRLRVDNVYGTPTPDRAEYLWARIGRLGPPLPEIGTDYQDLRFAMELGNESFSATTEIPLRMIDPVINRNTAGLGDMNVATKLVMLNGERWQITQLFRTHMNTGHARRGLGTGHISLEPGLLARYKWSGSLFLHSELKFWIPIGGDPVHSGQVLQYGLGTSHVLFETDTFAILDTFEFVAAHVLDGEKTVFGAPIPLPLDNDSIFHLHPGLRLVADTGGDLGQFELGLSGAFGLGSESSRWFDGLLRIDLRWSY